MHESKDDPTCYYDAAGSHGAVETIDEGSDIEESEVTEDAEDVVTPRGDDGGGHGDGDGDGDGDGEGSPSDGTDGSSSPDDDQMTLELSDNPAMGRVQLALRGQLSRTRERVRRDLEERTEELRAAKKRREDVGVELYGAQHQLARLQRGLEGEQDRHGAAVRARADGEDNVGELRRELGEKKSKAEGVRGDVVKSEAELESVLGKMRQARKYNDEMKGEVAVTRRAAYKAEENVRGLEKGKKSQDVYIDGLNEQIKRLEADVTLADAQLEEQRLQTEEADAMLSETGAELELLALEKKQLVQQWKSSLVALNQRDQALSAAGRALREAQAKSKDQRSELMGLKRDVALARAGREDLTLTRNRLENEIKFIENEIGKIMADQESTSEHFEMLQKTIANTNEAEAKVKSAMGKVSKEISTVNQKIQMVTRERQAYEKQIGTFKHEQTTMSKTTLSLAKEERALLVRIHDREIEVADIQNELTRLKIDALNTQAHSGQLRDRLDAELADLAKRGEEMERIEREIRRRNDEIEKKMNRVDRLNRRYEKMTEGADEPEPLGPLEATIKSLGRDVEREEGAAQGLQRQWLADQTELVRTIGETDTVQEKNTEFGARLNILKHKRLRLIQDMHVNEAEVRAVQTSMEGMHADMSRLNELISKNTRLRTELANENSIKEKEFVHELKDLEVESVRVEARIAEIKAAKRQVLDEIVEVERQVLLWEKKIMLEKETQAALRNSDEANDVKGMEKEIHRMRHRLEDLKRDQEKMIREMEHVIHKREDIAVKYKDRKDTGKGTKGTARSLTMAELKKKGATLRSQLKQASKETAAFKEKIEEAKHRIRNIKAALQKANEDFEKAQEQSKCLHNEINSSVFEKQRLLGKLDRQEEMAQKYISLKTGETVSVDPRKEQVAVEKRLATARAKMKRIQNVISGLRMKFSQFDEVFERVGMLAADVVAE